MAHSAEQLVGRAAEVGVLDGALGDLGGGRPAALEVAGEPGIGKTRLLAELAARAEAQGMLVLSGSGSEFEHELPFWIFVDALDEYVQTLEPRRLDALGHETLAELAHVLPSLPDPGADDGAGPRDDRYRAHRAVRSLLEGLAATKALVLLLDDLHWADSGSVELLGSLLRRPPDAAVLMSLALRPRQAPERLAGALDRARRDGALTRIELGALSADEARELLGADGDAAAAGFLLSIAASMGVVVWVFQDGNLADLFNVAQAGPILSFLPVLLIGILFGLAMDYQVFLVSRMRESYVHTGNARESVVTGYGQSGRVVVAAALIMIGVFGGFVLAHDPIVKSIGLSLAVGVLADAFIVRLTLIPAVMALLGRSAWKLPRRLERIVPEIDIEGEQLVKGLGPASAEPA
jgi:MMPL family/AAA ATPase domain